MVHGDRLPPKLPFLRMFPSHYLVHADVLLDLDVDLDVDLRIHVERTSCGYADHSEHDLRVPPILSL